MPNKVAARSNRWERLAHIHTHTRHENNKARDKQKANEDGSLFMISHFFIVAVCCRVASPFRLLGISGLRNGHQARANREVIQLTHTQEASLTPFAQRTRKCRLWNWTLRSHMRFSIV